MTPHLTTVAINGVDLVFTSRGYLERACQRRLVENGQLELWSVPMDEDGLFHKPIRRRNADMEEIAGVHENGCRFKLYDNKLYCIDRWGMRRLTWFLTVRA